MTIDRAINTLHSLKDYYNDKNEDSYVGFDAVDNTALDIAIKALEQQPKTGHWIEVIDEIDSFGNKTWHHECSICGNTNSGWGEYKYCPNCGARMEGEE